MLTHVRDTKTSSLTYRPFSGTRRPFSGTNLRDTQTKTNISRDTHGEGRRARNFAAEEAPTYTKITKELLSKDKELKEMSTFTTESLATKFEISKSKTTNIIRIFNGLKIVKEVLLHLIISFVTLLLFFNLHSSYFRSMRKSMNMYGLDIALIN